MEIDNKAVQVISDAIIKVFSDYMDSSQVILERGIIVDILEKNKYSIKIQGTTYVVPCCTEQIFKINDVVIVLAQKMRNGTSNKYIIGRA